MPAPCSRPHSIPPSQWKSPLYPLVYFFLPSPRPGASSAARIRTAPPSAHLLRSHSTSTSSAWSPVARGSLLLFRHLLLPGVRSPTLRAVHWEISKIPKSQHGNESGWSWKHRRPSGIPAPPAIPSQGEQAVYPGAFRSTTTAEDTSTALGTS
jgi:hypothetical protein